MDGEITGEGECPQEGEGAHGGSPRGAHRGERALGGGGAGVSWGGTQGESGEREPTAKPRKGGRADEEGQVI